MNHFILLVKINKDSVFAEIFSGDWLLESKAVRCGVVFNYNANNNMGDFVSSAERPRNIAQRTPHPITNQQITNNRFSITNQLFTKRTVGTRENNRAFVSVCRNTRHTKVIVVDHDIFERVFRTITRGSGIGPDRGCG